MVGQFGVGQSVATMLFVRLSLAGLLSLGWAMAAGVLIVDGPPMIEMTVRLIRLVRTPAARSLKARRAELAAGGTPV
ncbi:hypothetical protein J2S58_001784 [Nakamurella flavida]|nr:hypothetical protein [Nakamurella flavida]